MFWNATQNFHFRLNRNDFQHLSSLIVTIFPTEAEGTYFIASKKGSSPSGKLVSMYSNLRNMMASVGLIARDKRNSTNETSILDQSNIVELTVDEVNAQEYIEGNNFEDRESMKEAWQITSEGRDKFLQTNISTSDYLKKYPCLMELDGYELVSLLEIA